MSSESLLEKFRLNERSASDQQSQEAGETDEAEGAIQRSTRLSIPHSLFPTP
ncbi:MAG: hypothetical protein KME42_18030 [Tildeniella nuda ZEHNDER 1965/U140]|nr:hypothetical protein [Tildeniella nuda ZEHNDER 1965/U140]